MSKLANILLSEEKNEVFSKLTITTSQSDSQFLALSTDSDNTETEYLEWGENRNKIGTFQDGNQASFPVLSLHLDSKEAIAIQQLEALLQALSKADYFSDSRQLILLGDLNINLADKKARQNLANIFEKINLMPEALVFESPIERERSISIALNQQPHKGGQKKTDVKNVIFVLRNRQLADAPVIERLNHTYASLATPKKMGKDGFDHNPVAIKHKNTLYISVSNIPTQVNGKAAKHDVIMTEEALEADLRLRDHMMMTLNEVFKIKVSDLSEYGLSLQKCLEIERQQAPSDLNFAINLINNMQIFINKIINSDQFNEYKEKRVRKEFSELLLHKALLGSLVSHNNAPYSSLNDVLSDLNPEHRVAKAIKQIIVDDKPNAMKVERLLTNFFEMISPQPNNGYEPALLSPEKMESLRLDIIHNLIHEYPETSKISIYCNDTREKDYHSFPVMLAEIIKHHAISMNNHSQSFIIGTEDEKQNIEIPAQRHSSCFAGFFNRMKKSICYRSDDIVPKRRDFSPH